MPSRTSSHRRFRSLTRLTDFRSNKDAWNTRRQVDINTEVEGILGVETVTTTSHTAGDNEVIEVDDDAAGSTVTVTLPSAALSIGRNYHIKKLGTTAAVIVDGASSELIDGAQTMTIGAQYDCMEICCNGAGWNII